LPLIPQKQENKWWPVSGSPFERRTSRERREVLTTGTLHSVERVCVCVCVHNWPHVLLLPQQGNAANQCLLEAETLQDQPTSNWLGVVSIPVHSMLHSTKLRPKPREASAAIYLTRHSRKFQQTNTNTGTPRLKGR